MDEKEKPEVKEKRFEVKVVGDQGGNAVVVEWVEGNKFQRATLPRKEIPADFKVAQSVLETGLPYGLDFSKLGERLTYRPEIIGDLLRRAGVWTYEDLYSKHDRVLGVIQEVLGIEYANIIKACIKEVK